MRTTVDISDQLLRRAKSRAAREGVRLRDLIEHGLRLVLGGAPAPKAGARVEFPLHRSRRPGALSAEDVRLAEQQAQLAEDAAHVGAV